MADYIYLLENRLTGPQQRALSTIRSVARAQDYTVFLFGGAVRDMTGGGAVRDLDFIVQGNALQLRSALEGAGAEIYGQHEPSQRLFLRLPGGVRVEVASAMVATYPKPGVAEYQPASLIEALRSRDFTANAMAVSLNDGSYGLLMDPLNGVADIENRELRLISNYGFIEDPSRLIRAARLRARLGWQLEERTGQRYETGKQEGYMEALSPWHRGYELEEIFHEEDPLRVLRALEGEGWLTAISPALHASKANAAALNEIAERQGQLMMRGLAAQTASLYFPLVTAKSTPEEVAELKQLFVRPGFLQEIESLDARTREFANGMTGKDMAAPSAVWRMLHAAEPNLVLSAAYSSKSSTLQSRLKTFLNDSPGSRQRVPYVLMQEMRITPELPGYEDLVETLVFELMDNKLSTTEEMKAFLEPYSPPAPPPPLNLRRARAKKEARPSRAKGKKSTTEADAMPLSVAAQEETVGVDLDIMEPGTLTGPDRGPDPTPDEPMYGNVTPTVAQVTAATPTLLSDDVERVTSNTKSVGKRDKAAVVVQDKADKVSATQGDEKPRGASGGRKLQTAPKVVVAVPPPPVRKGASSATAQALSSKPGTKQAPTKSRTASKPPAPASAARQSATPSDKKKAAGKVGTPAGKVVPETAKASRKSVGEPTVPAKSSQGQPVKASAKTQPRAAVAAIKKPAPTVSGKAPQGKAKPVVTKVAKTVPAKQPPKEKTVVRPAASKTKRGR